MPIASVIAWCDPGQSAAVAEVAGGLVDVEVYAIQADRDAVVLVLEAEQRRGIDQLWQSCLALPGVRWIDGAWYGDEAALAAAEGTNTAAAAGADKPQPSQGRSES